MKAGSISFLTALGWLPSSERMYVTLTDLLSLSLPSYENLAGLVLAQREMEKQRFPLV